MAVERGFLGLEFVHFGALGEVKGLVPLPGIIVGCVLAPSEFMAEAIDRVVKERM